jgi:biopolymer transport protein TolQ
VLDNSLLHFFVDAGPVVKVVMFILLILSVFSWTFIFQRFFLYKRTDADIKEFEDHFWSGVELAKLYRQLNDSKKPLTGTANIFRAGFKEFMRMREQSYIEPDALMASIQRAMRIADAREYAMLETHLPFLATVGSVAPYIGLFGTVWGIMTAFRALGVVQQATISMVAPGIAEALIATAMGLFAAIPAVISYNRYAHRLEKYADEYQTFQEELSNILAHECYDNNEA